MSDLTFHSGMDGYKDGDTVTSTFGGASGYFTKSNNANEAHTLAMQSLQIASSISSAQVDSYTADYVDASKLQFSTPKLPQANSTLLQQGSSAPMDKEKLTDTVLNNVLNSIPQFKNYVKDSGDNPQELMGELKTFLLNSNVTAGNIGKLAGDFLGDKMQLVASLHTDNPGIQNDNNALKMTLYENQAPEVRVLKNLLINSFTSQGMTKEQATAKANEEGVQLIQGELGSASKTGATSLSQVVQQLLGGQLGPMAATDTGKAFIATLGASLTLEKSFISLFSNAPGADGTPPSIQDNSIKLVQGINLHGAPPEDAPGVSPTGTIDPAKLNGMINTETATLDQLTQLIQGLPLPANEIMALTTYLKQLHDNLNELQAFTNEIASMDAKKNQENSLARLSIAAEQYEGQMKHVQDMIDAIHHMIEEMKKFAPLKIFSAVLGDAMLGIFAVIAILLIILLGPIGLIVGLILVAAPATMVALRETGTMDKLMNSIMLISNEVCAMIYGNKAKDNPPWLGVVVLVCILAVVFIVVAVVALLIVVVMAVIAVLMLVLTVLMGVIGALVAITIAIITCVITTIVSLLACTVAGVGYGVIVGAIIAIVVAVTVLVVAVIVAVVELVVTVVQAVVQFMCTMAVVILLIAVVTLVLQVLMQLIVNCLLSSHVITAIAVKVGQETGMSNEDVHYLSMALTCVLGAFCAACGGQMPNSAFNLSFQFSNEVPKEDEGMLQAEYDDAKFHRDLIMPYLVLNNLMDQYMQNVLKPEIDDKIKDYEEMKVLFLKLVKFLKKMIQEILSGGGGKGGDSGAYKDVIKNAARETQQFMKDNMTDFLPPGFMDNLDLSANLPDGSTITSDLQKSITPQFEQQLMEFVTGGKINDQPMDLQSLYNAYTPQATP